MGQHLRVGLDGWRETVEDDIGSVQLRLMVRENKVCCGRVLVLQRRSGPEVLARNASGGNLSDL